MMTWRTIPDEEVDPNSPVTSQLVTALRDNPPAINNGDSGAPVLSSAWHPYNLTTAGGSQDGIIYDHAVDGDITTLDSPDFEDGYSYQFVFTNLEADGTVSLSVELTGAGGFSPAVAILFEANLQTSGAYVVELPYPRLLARSTPVLIFGDDVSGAVQPGVAGRALRMGVTAQRRAVSARFTIENNGIEDGVIRMNRRREFVS